MSLGTIMCALYKIASTEVVPDGSRNGYIVLHVQIHSDATILSVG